MTNRAEVEQWSIFELTLSGPQDGNPFLDVQLSARFQSMNRIVEPEGFYDGEGIYRLRFMPDTVGVWRYETQSSIASLNGVSGEFTCIPAGAGNHGPVEVRHVYHFAYADGMPYVQVGTTCYAWTSQEPALEEQTLQTLQTTPFNKLRMCVFPKYYAFNHNEPPLYPFEQSSDGGWDFARLNPVFFRHFEQRVADLLRLGIEADVILWHPYDRWGFATMDAASDDRYLRYVVARLAAYRNVWWSLANEWDLMQKSVADWDRFFRILVERDPSQHLRSIHNCNELFDHTRPSITHVSIQISNFNMNLEQMRMWRSLYRKPIVIDECCYEGDIPQRWGNLTAQEMVRRFWEGTIHGGYVGHGETFLHPQDILWWSKGGTLHGESVPRIAFLKQILDDSPAEGLNPLPTVNGDYFLCAGISGDYTLIYTGVHRPGRLSFTVPDGHFSADVIDTWNMTISRLPDSYTGIFSVPMPAQPYMALLLRRII